MSNQTQSLAKKNRTGDIIVNGFLLLIVILWTIPTLGILVSSFRTRFDIQTSGWWWILPHREWVAVDEIELSDDLDPDGIMEIAGVSGTFDEFREGISTKDGQQITWVGNKRLGRIEIKENKWVMRTNFTLNNYGQVLIGKEYEIQTASGESMIVQGDDFTGAFLNSLTVAIPATVIPILIAAFAAYGFAWMNFPGRKLLFVMVVALLVVPLQIALVPILKDYVKLDLNGTFLAVWLAHTGFGLPLATYLLFNYIKGLPREILESAFIDGASHFTIFVRLILPLSIPALASFAIFQFLWVWNDYLVALVFIGAKPDVQVLTMRIAELVGSRGSDWHLLTAGAFVSMVLPLLVFTSLQRFFVRGLLAGSVKG
ncbi:MAG: carbohydrate ABC transporter permease [Chloroflexota bacterium]|nr:carbohydrate ABC transporter permease [Chloroflexota bacterium]